MDPPWITQTRLPTSGCRPPVQHSGEACRPLGEVVGDVAVLTYRPDHHADVVVFTGDSYRLNERKPGRVLHSATQDN